jgi:hypothetical protein
MILRSAAVRIRERGKRGGNSPPPTPRGRSPSQEKKKCFNFERGNCTKGENAYTHIPLRADSFLKVNAKIAKTVNSHTLSPNTLMQEETLLTAPVGQLGMKQSGNLLAKQSRRQKEK